MLGYQSAAGAANNSGPSSGVVHTPTSGPTTPGSPASSMSGSQVNPSTMGTTGSTTGANTGTTGSTYGTTGTTGSTMGSAGTTGSTMGSNTAPSGSAYGTTGSTMGSNTNMSSDEVRQLQQALNDNGENLNVDGVMGPETERALRDYQQKNGLQASGTLDEQTRQKLNIRG